MPPATRPSPWRRLAAYAIDSLVIVAYIVALTAVSLAAQALLGVSMNQIESPLTLQLISFTTLTLPVILYFAIMQAGPRSATLGKRALGLRVRTRSGEPPRLQQTLLRAATKFLPWEIAHTGIWLVSSDPDADHTLSTALFYVSLAIALLYVLGLFTPTGRTLYDRCTGTRVVPAKRPLSSPR